MNTPRSGDPACAHGRSLLGPCVECEQLWKGSSVSTEQPISERSPTELEDQDRCEHGVAMAEACEQCAAEDDEWICAHIPEDVATQKLAGEQGERSYSPSDVERVASALERIVTDPSNGALVHNNEAIKRAVQALRWQAQRLAEETRGLIMCQDQLLEAERRVDSLQGDVTQLTEALLGVERDLKHGLYDVAGLRIRELLGVQPDRDTT